MAMPGISYAPLTETEKNLAAMINAVADGRDGSVPISFYEKNYDVYGPQAIRDAFQDVPYCHDAGHNFGRVVYDRSDNFTDAVLICGASCTGGCIHGVLMQMFQERSDLVKKPSAPGEHISLNDLKPGFQEDIKNICTSSSTVTSFTGMGNCYHAVGHAFAALAELDIPSALNLCRVFEDVGVGAVYYCATGVYMEREVETGSYDAKISNTFPCDDSLFPAACFRYKFEQVFEFPRDIEAAKSLCLSLSGNEQEGCFHGLGLSSYKALDKDPSLINSVCGSGSAEDQRMCLEGAIGILKIYDPSKVNVICDKNWTGDRNMCQSAAKIFNFGMNRDFGPYVQKAENSGFFAK
jgi:hypothetical protein